MRVKQGWSGEVEPNKWSKVTVELDEGDLGRLLREAEIAADMAHLPTAMVYTLLEVEAERLVLMKLMVRHGYPQQEGVRELAGLQQGKNDCLEAIRTLTSKPALAR